MKRTEPVPAQEWNRNGAPSRQQKLLPPVNRHHDVCVAVVPTKIRRITRSRTRAIRAAHQADLFGRATGPLLASGYLRWHDVVRLSQVNECCHDAWVEARETYDGWKPLLKELHSTNCTNRCSSCEQIVQLKSNRDCCTRQQWQDQSASRNPDFHGVIDLLMASGFLNWRERGGVRKISKHTYFVHKEQCTCASSSSSSPRRTTVLLRPFLAHDPRYMQGYEYLSAYQQCQHMVRYTSWMIQNLHSFYNFHRVTDPNCLPESLERKKWMDLQMVTLQRECPHRYGFIMNIMSLFLAQGELQRSPPYWYSNAFLGRRDLGGMPGGNGGPGPGTTAGEMMAQQQDAGMTSVTSTSYFECLGSGISEFCLPATDEVLTAFLRTKCYPSLESQDILGPLVKPLSLFAPFFDMVPLDPHGAQPIRMPPRFETLNDEMIDNMSIHLFCTIS
jgi:hypothetical protein